jgi:serine/threonine protein kinase/tetratricopeptide (TPR) repeat protein
VKPLKENRRELLAALDPLLEQVLDLDADEREIRLAAMRLERPALARELEALLTEESRLEARGFLQSDEYLGLSGELPSLAGLRIGAYTLGEPIGRGGMGSVWLARRTDGRFEGKAAVKLLNLALLDSVGVERFAREGTVLAQLTHPNIARLLDAGVTDAGQPFLVLEHVEGLRIDLYCDEHRLGPMPRLALCRQVLEAVAHAHAHLIVHRDLKPSNILVTSDGNVKLLDFGIAKLLEAESSAAERSELTARGGLTFTPEYAAPEQVLGGPITTATDVYSLGVLMYLLLTGRHPTSGGSLTTAGHLSGILDTEPLRMSVAVAGSGAVSPEDLAQAAAARGSTVERLRRLYRGDLDNILAKALKKDPTQRYPTVTAFADELERFFQHQPVQARPDSFGYRARKFVRRNRPQVLAGTLTAFALIGATVATTSQMIEARRQRDEARVQRDNAVYHERRAAASSGFMEFLLQSIAPTGKAYTMQELLDKAREMLEADYRGDPRFMGRMMVELGDHYFELHDRKRELALLSRAEELATASNDMETAGYASCRLAKSAADDGDAVGSQRTLDRASRYLARLPESAEGPRVQCLRARSALARLLDRPGEALAHAQQAVRLGDAAGDSVSHHHLGAVNEVARALHDDGQVRASLHVTRTLIGTLERIGRGRTLTMVVERHNEAALLSRLGEKRKAASRLARVVDLASGMNPEKRVPTYMTLLAGELAGDLGRPDSAVAIFKHALAEAKERGDTPYQVRALSGLSGALIDRGKLGEARQYLDELQSVVPEKLRWRADGLEAHLIYAQGNKSEGQRRYLDLLASRGFPNRGLSTPSFASMVLDASLMALGSGDAVAAESLARHAFRLARGEGQDETQSGTMGYARVTLARARRAAGDPATAVEELRRSLGALVNGYGPDHPRTLEARVLLDSISLPSRTAGGTP